MDVFNDQLVDIGLNALGYLVAAALGMLLHSAFTNRRRAAAIAASVEGKTVSCPTASTGPASRPGLEYVDLRQVSAGRKTGSSRKATEVKHEIRRDRPEIIRLARQMVKAGTPGDIIRRTLSISDAELALLQSGNND